MKKPFCLLGCLLFSSISLVGCSSKTKQDDNVLRIYNWQDYIFEGDDENDSVIEQFKEYYKEKHDGKEIKVEYYTFETNENMLNVLNTGKSQYDLICPSDYTIQKMIKDGLVEPIIDPTTPEDKIEEEMTKKLPNYTSISPYIRELFETSLTKNKQGEDVSWASYSIPYMWGTMGFMYDPNQVDEEDIKSWSVVWDKKYKYKATLKDSVRDTYCACVFYVYQDELNELSAKLESKEITESQYTAKITEIMNRKDKATIKKVEKALQEAKENIYGFEVDSGKSDIVTGKIAINFCWSGDAVYSMDTAEEENDTYLNYVVPKEGSNIWFDGWVLGKNANKELAYEFLNFLCDPRIASLNMNEIGYTSSVAGNEILDMVKEWYESEEITEDSYAVDLSWFFGDTVEEGEAIIYTDELDRQFSAQYPDYETVIRCAIMEDFGKENTAILEMWSRAKSESHSLWAWIVIILSIVAAVAFVCISKANRHVRTKRVANKNKLNQTN